MKKILIIGHSHVFALRRANKNMEIDGADSFEVDFLEMQNSRYSPNIVGPAPLELNPSLQSDLVEISKNTDFVVSCARGGEHNILGLLRHPKPFDFFLSESPDRSIEREASLIPEGLVSDRLRMTTKMLRIYLHKLRELIPSKIPILQLESPPPIPSVNHIMKYKGAYSERMDELGISPKNLRYKLWRVYGNLVSEYCNECGVQYIKVPKLAQDSEGFLVEEAWNNDPTHGNEYYGKLALENLFNNYIGDWK